MTALAASRNTPQRGTLAVSDVVELPVADNVKGYAGGIAVLSGGYVQAATAALGLVGIGRIEADFDNTVAGHAAGAFNVRVRPGVFLYANGTGADAIAQANVGQLCYLIDDQTVGLTDGNGARSPAGVIMEYTSGGIYVAIGMQSNHGAGVPQGAAPQFSISIPVPAMSAIANAGVLARFTPGFAGRIKSIQFQVTTAVTTAAKAATLTPAIAGTSVTGGACALTSANCTPIGANVAGSAITALNTFTAAQEITVVASSVTAFLEGAGAIILNFG